MSEPHASRGIPVTLNCSGGVSLGAYMAGVFYELIREAVQDQPAIHIDIIAGASAGAMTGTIAAYYLLHQQAKALLAEEKISENALYQAWVEKADITQIDTLGLRPEVDEKTGCKNWSVLSGSYLKEMSDDLLQLTDDILTEQTRPLALLMTLTNLSGLLQSNRDSLNGDLKTISYAETRLFLFHGEVGRDRSKVEAMWEKALVGGRASGAFPVAFPPVGDDSSPDSYNLIHCTDDYRPPDQPHLRTICEPNKNGKYKFLYSYTDGGVLDGLPINQGIGLFRQLIADDPVEQWDAQDFSDDYKQEFLKFREAWRHHADAQDISDPASRRYVYIQPNPVQNLSSSQDLLRRCFSMLQVGFKGLTLPKAEHDAIRLQNIQALNEVVHQYEALTDRLQQENVQLSPEAQAILNRAMPFIPVQLARIDPLILQKLPNLPKLSHLYDELLKKEGFQPRLESDDANQLLASDFFGAFGGFFEQRFRDHDFVLGRLSGLAWLHENCPSIQTPVPSDLVAAIADKILTEEPQLNPSGWLRVARMALRTLRILFIQANNKRWYWKILIGGLRLIAILVLGFLELLLTLMIAMFGVIKR